MSKTNNNRREFLLGFFNPEERRQEAKKLNGFILLKKWDGKNERFTVDIFTPESFEKWQQYQGTKLL
jgi:hypothetical protein